MEKSKQTHTNAAESVVMGQSGPPNHTEKITLQVLAKIGQPPRFERVEVCRYHNGKYRVNVWQQFKPSKDVVVTPSSRIGPSYYLAVSDTGDIIHSDPPMKRLGFDT